MHQLSASSLKPAKRKRRKEARPGEIIAAGLQEFSNNGFAATRLEDIAARAEISKGTIYRYFKDKNELFHAVMLAQTSSTFGQIDQAVDNFGGTTRELIVQIFKVIHSSVVHGNMHIILRIILSEGRNFPDLAGHYYQQGIAKGQRILEKVIKRGILRGEIRKGAASNLPIVIFAPALMAAIWKMLFERHHSISQDDFFEAHVDLVLNGILKSGQD